MAVIFLGKPESPTDFQEVESAKTSTSITIEWIPGQYHRDTQVFVINFGRVGKKMKHKKIPDDGSQKMVYIIDRLRAGKSYEITIKAVNYVGSSSTSHRLSVKTKGTVINNYNRSFYPFMDTFTELLCLSFADIVYKTSPLQTPTHFIQTLSPTSWNFYHFICSQTVKQYSTYNFMCCLVFSL
jgi:hypothetical protein